MRRLARRHNVTYAEYVNDSGYVQAEPARPKVGEPRDEVRLGIIPWDPTVDPDSIVVTWVEPAEADGRDVVVHGPFWSLEGDRAVVEIRSHDYHDRWISLLDPATGATTVLDHQHDDAWIGGPDPVNNYLGPGLLEWLPGGRLVLRRRDLSVFLSPLHIPTTLTLEHIISGGRYGGFQQCWFRGNKASDKTWRVDPRFLGRPRRWNCRLFGRFRWRTCIDRAGRCIV